ncbi:MAG: response regulator [Spirochaetota bacterium]|nr:response regulator [Spirochaetota bacterium]
MGKNILSIDDSSSMRQIIKSCLEKEGFKVFEAQDGLQGLEKINSSEIFDLFLVDVNMPNMDGISFVKELRKNHQYKNTPVVMLTTESQNEKKLEGQQAGATGWVIKPFNPEEFIKVVKRLTN